MQSNPVKAVMDPRIVNDAVYIYTLSRGRYITSLAQIIVYRDKPGSMMSKEFFAETTTWTRFSTYLGDLLLTNDYLFLSITTPFNIYTTSWETSNLVRWYIYRFTLNTTPSPSYFEFTESWMGQTSFTHR